MWDHGVGGRHEADDRTLEVGRSRQGHQRPGPSRLLPEGAALDRRATPTQGVFQEPGLSVPPCSSSGLSLYPLRWLPGLPESRTRECGSRVEAPF